MKKFGTLALAVLLLTGNVGHAQARKMGSGAQAGTYSDSNDFAWGIGLGVVVVLGIVVGCTVAAATGNSNS